MKHIFLMIFVIISFVPISSFHFDSLSEDPALFQLIRKENNVSIYSRWILIDEEYSTRELKAEFIIEASTVSAITVLKDDKTARNWMQNTEKVLLLNRTNDSLWYTYIQFSVPWPLNDQDCVLKYTVNHNPQGSIDVAFKNLPTYLNPYDDITRMNDFQGRWVLSPMKAGQTKIEYYVFSRDKARFPRWITDPIIQNNLIQTMTGFKKEVESII